MARVSCILVTFDTEVVNINNISAYGTKLITDLMANVPLKRRPNIGGFFPTGTFTVAPRYTDAVLAFLAGRPELIAAKENWRR